jgi:PAS domain S-box-containing protein
MTNKKPRAFPRNESTLGQPQFGLIAELALLALRTPSLEAVIATATHQSAKCLRADLSAFFEFLPERDLLALRGGVGWHVGCAEQVNLRLQDVCPPNSSMDATTPLVMPDIRVGFPATALSVLRENGVVSGLAVGVECEGLPFGLLAVYTLVRRDFTPQEMEWLQGLATALSAAATRALEDQRLREHEARLSGIIASAMDAIIAVDATQQIVLFNQAAERVFRCSASEVLGTSLDRFIPARFRETHREQLRRFGESGSTSRRMSRLDPLSGLRADGEEFPMEASISQAEVAAERIFTVILRDISERRRFEEQLLHAQKLESVGRLAGGIAHDFNNVLTAVFGYVDLARSHAAGNGPVQECLNAVQVAAGRAAELTSKLLAFARKQPIEPRVVDLNQLVRGVLGMAERLLGENVDIAVHETPLLPNVRVDPGQFEQVLINLAVNARDAMPRGGKFIVETSRVELDEEYTRLRPDVEPGTYVLLAVSDTGVGMDSVTLEHCFEPFFTTKRAGRGTGLGLATCHGMVSQNGGHIAVYSEPNHGTTFRIFLPACADPVQQTLPTAAAEARPQGGLILLVEDEPLVRGIAARALRDHGYTVIEAADAGEALARSALVSEDIDLLLTDVVLPKVGGSELAEQLRQSRPQMRVLFTSGFTDEAIAEQGLLPAGAAFLPKPYTSLGLASKVRSMLSQPRNADQQT